MEPDRTVPATLLADPEWVRARIGGAAKLYGCARPEVLGTIWWYSLSSVLVAPAVESLVTAAALAGSALEATEIEPALAAPTLEAGPAAQPAPTGPAPEATEIEPAAGPALGDPALEATEIKASAEPALADPALEATEIKAAAGPALADPALEATEIKAAAEPALADPALEAMELDLVADGRFLGARSTRLLSGGLPELGAAFGKALGTAIATIAAVTGARARALGAIATDSIGNRLLWTPDPERAMTLAGPLVAAIGLDLPKPRFVRVGRAPAVRRASCCLIYEVGNPKCVSCPRQTPAERDARLRATLG